MMSALPAARSVALRLTLKVSRLSAVGTRRPCASTISTVTKERETLLLSALLLSPPRGEG